METEASKKFKCSACGEIVSAEDEVCPKCGARFVEKNEKSKGWIFWVIIIALAIFWFSVGKKLFINWFSNMN